MIASSTVVSNPKATGSSDVSGLVHAGGGVGEGVGDGVGEGVGEGEGIGVGDGEGNGVGLGFVIRVVVADGT